jgi:hypothetical protein
MRMRGFGRERRAVMSALRAVGEQGMSLDALSLAVDLSEPDLQALLHQLVLSGHVRRIGDDGLAAVGRRGALYRLAHPSTLYIPAPRRAV